MATKKSSDEIVLDMLRKVQQKKDEIAKASKKPSWKTNCTIGYNPETTDGRVNIMTVKDPAKLNDLYAFLLQKEEYLDKASTELGLDLDLTYMGYPITDWKEDLKSRAAALGIDKKKRELDELDKRVNGLVSQEQRREMELEALAKVLGD